MTLYRQYRPTRFADLIGQDVARTILTQALLKKRLSHAYLFSGSRGTGKTSTARIFAKAICCTARSEQAEPCNTCAMCLAITQGHTPDLIEIDAASNRGIEDIRTLREQVQYPPIQLGQKIYIIDEVHMLTGDAFNALLKTLEEPPQHAVFILATTELHRVPITIRSRCQLVSFARGSVADISKKLQHIAELEKWKVEPEALTLVAEHADGGYRDAETILEQIMTVHDTLTVDVVTNSLGVVTSSARAELLSAVRSRNSKLVRQTLATFANGSVKRYEAIITSLIDDVRSTANLDIFETHLLECLLEAYILQKSSPSPSLPLEIACLKATYFEGDQSTPPRTTSNQRATTTPSTAEPKKEAPASAPAIEARILPHPTQPATHTVPVIELRDKESNTFTADVRKAWKELIHEVAAENAPLAQALRQAKIHTAEGGLITVHVRYKFHCEKLAEKKHRNRVEKLLAQYTGEAWQVHYELNQQVSAAPAKKQLSEGPPPQVIQPVDLQEVAAIFTANPSTAS